MKRPQSKPPRPTTHGVARWISKFGILSRTEAERAVRAGRVAVNGQPTRDPERRCDPERDRIFLDGQPLRAARRVYLALHKPVGYITTASDPERRPTAYELLPRIEARVQAVGRLDADTSGLLLFTNDTAFAASITEGHNIEKTYVARVAGRVTRETARRFERGVDLDDRPTLPARCRILKAADASSTIEVTLREGRNRQVRRMWEALEHPVLELRRTRIGPVELGTLPPGRSRPISEFERAVIAHTTQPEGSRD